MCGIAGAVWTANSDGISQSVLDRMTDILQHRGPDGRGTYFDNAPDGLGVALGHRRLSIIDLAAGSQPLSNEDDSVWITFNGEIYNYRELRTELESAGHRFRTNSDTETIVHLYEQYGIECLSRLRGMFAFAIWDRNHRRLLMARDRLGQKPFVYCHHEGRILFASEIKSLLLVPGVRRDIDRVSLEQYLTYGYVPHPRTMFAGISKLPPAHYAIFQDGQLKTDRYWSIDWEQESSAPAEKLREQLRHELSEAVRLRMRSDVPLGAFLSGGIDSTAIVGLMREHADNVQTYTIGFPVKEYDETEYARIAASHLETDHHELMVEPNSIGILPKLVWHFDEPFADSSAIPTYYVSQATRQHVTVALTGDGGDELFAGYARYDTIERLGRFDRLPGWLRRLATNRIWDFLPAHREDSLTRRLQFRMQILRESPDERYVHWVSQFSPGLRQALLADDVTPNGVDSAAFVADVMRKSRSRSPGSMARLTDLETYLPCDLLAKVDITSMAFGLECRSPFLDHKVVELATQLPFSVLRDGMGQKPFLTRTLPDLIPRSLRARGKMGFRIPLDDWFRGKLGHFVRRELLDSGRLAANYLCPCAIRTILDEHEQGLWNHGDRIWSLLFLELWYRTYIEHEPPETAPVSLEESGTIDPV